MHIEELHCAEDVNGVRETNKAYKIILQNKLVAGTLSTRLSMPSLMAVWILTLSVATFHLQAKQSHELLKSLLASTLLINVLNPHH